MIYRINDRDGDVIEIEALPASGVVFVNLPTDDGDEGPGRALTRDQCAKVISVLTEAAKELP